MRRVYACSPQPGNPNPPTPFPPREGGASRREIGALEECLDIATSHPFPRREAGALWAVGVRVFPTMRTLWTKRAVTSAPVSGRVMLSAYQSEPCGRRTPNRRGRAARAMGEESGDGGHGREAQPGGNGRTGHA